MKDGFSKIEVFKFNLKKSSVLVSDREDVNVTNSSYLNSYEDSLDVLPPKDEILFFKPDFYWSEESWLQVCDKTSDVFDLDEKCVVSYSKRSSGFDGINLELGVDSDFEVYESRDFEFGIDGSDCSELKNRCLNGCNSSFFRCTNLKYDQDSFGVSEANGKLFFKSSGKLKGSVLFWYSASIKDRLIFKYFKSSDATKKTNYIRKIIRDKKNDYVKDWSEDDEYKKNDIVYYSKFRYRAKCEVTKGVTPPNDASGCWECLDASGSFFYENSDFLKNNLGYYIEKKIGDRIRLILMNSQKDPKLNDLFVYKNKKYRIIEMVFRYYGSVKQMIIQGLELLDINIDFELSFQNDFNQLCDVKFDSDHSKVVFSAPSKYSLSRDQQVLLKTEDARIRG